MKRVFVLIIFLLLIGCQTNTPTNIGETAVDPSPADPSEEEVRPYPYSPVDESVSSESQEGVEARLEISGEPEVVFDWTTDSCEEEHIADIAPRAFRDADGNVQLIIGHYYNYRMIGPDLNSIESDCTQLMRSVFDPDPSQFNEAGWIAAPYTEDGSTIYAVVLNEYRGDLHRELAPAQCPSNDRLICLDTSLTLVVSTNGGDSYQHIAEPPNHLISTEPSVYDDEDGPTGTRQPSNIIKGDDGYYYMYTSILEAPKPGAEWGQDWVCLMRTNDLADPTSWRYWDGEGFSGQFINPYLENINQSPDCSAIDFDALGGSANETITWNTVLERYIIIGFASHPASSEPIWGYYYSFSDDLLHWTPRKLLIELPSTSSVDPNTAIHFAYPSLIDPDSPSRNFETSDDQAFLYVNRFNAGFSLDRDLIRYPVQITPPSYPAPSSWRFDEDANTGGWSALTDLEGLTAQDGSLVMTSTGEDSVLQTAQNLTIPANQYYKLWIRMKVSGGGTTGGELFFTTDADTELDGNKYLYFDVTPDDEWHDYLLDLSEVETWAGVVNLLRLDPVIDSGREIKIDIIAFVE